jgi:rubrerythrin
MNKTQQIINEFERFVQEYDRDVGCTSYDSEVFKGVLALLKAREPVAPLLNIDTWECRKCGHILENQELLGDNVLFHEQYNYCPNCGNEVKWNA